MREVHAVKKTREFHDNDSENISGESIGGAALINLFVPDAALIRGRRLFEQIRVRYPWIQCSAVSPSRFKGLKVQHKQKF